MNIESAVLFNFGSYDYLAFEFNNQGLTLIQGATGAGKSTIYDAVSWVLYGQTAKNGTVDEVRSWTGNGEPTQGRVNLQVNGKTVGVSRTRGTPQQNDLVFYLGTNTGTRGKDMQDTQRLLNESLGVSADLYMAAAYFSDFSPSARFFSATAKDRRALFEQIAPLQSATNLVANSTNTKKSRKTSLETVLTQAADAKTKLAVYMATVKSQQNSSDVWEKTKSDRLVSLSQKSRTFTKDNIIKINELQRSRNDFHLTQCKLVADSQASVESLKAILLKARAKVLELTLLAKQEAAKCDKCGSVLEHSSATDTKQLLLKEERHHLITDREISNLLIKIDRELLKENPYDSQLAAAKQNKNQFLDLLRQENATANPFTAPMELNWRSACDLNGHVAGLAEAEVGLRQEISDLDTLVEIAGMLRAYILQSSIQYIEQDTNRLLESHFDAALRVKFEAGSDNLEVSIQKNGYDCSFRQLSKGQRGLLRLCFGVAVMRYAGDCAKVKLSALFFDEALDGLDGDLKVKAFNLFAELSKEHGSVFLIDHSAELQNMFENTYLVELVGDNSTVKRV